MKDEKKSLEALPIDEEDKRRENAVEHKETEEFREEEISVFAARGAGGRAGRRTEKRLLEPAENEVTQRTDAPKGVENLYRPEPVSVLSEDSGETAEESGSVFSYLFSGEDRDPYDALMEKREKDALEGKTTVFQLGDIKDGMGMPEQEIEDAAYTDPPEIKSGELTQTVKKDFSVFEEEPFVLQETEERERNPIKRLWKKFRHMVPEGEDDEEEPIVTSLRDAYENDREELPEGDGFENIKGSPLEEINSHAEDAVSKEEASVQEEPQETEENMAGSESPAREEEESPAQEEKSQPDREQAGVQSESGGEAAEAMPVAEAVEPQAEEETVREELPRRTDEPLSEEAAQENSSAETEEELSEEKIPAAAVLEEKTVPKPIRIEGPFLIFEEGEEGQEKKIPVYTPEGKKSPLVIPEEPDVYSLIKKEYEREKGGAAARFIPVKAEGLQPEKIAQAVKKIQEKKKQDQEVEEEKKKPVPLPHKPKKAPGKKRKKEAVQKGTAAIDMGDGMKDYVSPGDAPAIKKDIFVLYRQLQLKTAALGVLTLFSGVMAVLARFEVPLPDFLLPNGGETLGYVLWNLAVLLIGGLLSLNIFRNGWRSFLHMQGDVDLPLAAAGTFCLLQTLYLLINRDALADGSSCLYTPVLLFALFLNGAGKLFLMKRTRNNFRFIISSEPKYAMHMVETREEAAKLVNLPTEELAISYCAPTSLLAKFLHISYAYDRSEQMTQKYSIWMVVACIGTAILNFILTFRVESALQTLCVAACICVPVTNLLCINIPVYQSGKRLLKKGVMLSGDAAVEQFGDSNFLMVRDTDLFPKGTVTLHLIKTFSQQRVDEAILDAAALICATGGPMSDMFSQIIQGKSDMLPKVDGIEQEDGKGVVGWVGGRRVLIGNGALMEQYGMMSPSRDFEEKYNGDGQFISYLAVGGDLVAMFVMDYAVDEEVAIQVQNLADQGIHLAVRTMDSNITSVMLAQKFDIPSHKAVILGNEEGKRFDAYREETPEADALLGVSGRFHAVAQGLLACKKLKNVISLSMILQALSVVLGFVLVFFLVIASGISQLSAFEAFIFQLFWTVVIVGNSLLRKYR